MPQPKNFRPLFLLLWLAAALFWAGWSEAAVITIVNLDGANEGFNDPTPVAPVGGNPGTTIGQQRLNVFQRVAEIWGAKISSSVPIQVGASFDALSCTANSAVLGSAGTVSVFRNFSGAPVANTWYPGALANALAGTDLDPSNHEIEAQFNSNIGQSGCLSSLSWYYGLDGNPPSGTIELLDTVLHEVAHGLGFATYVDDSTGAKLSGFDDVFMRNLEDHSTGKLYPNMTDAERVTANIDTGDLHWVGSNVVANSGFLTSGRGANGHVEMYAPNPVEPGSSVSHFNTSLTPDELMEPYLTALSDRTLTTFALKDIGWVIIPDAAQIQVTGATISSESCTATNGAIDPDETVTVNFVWQNIGGADTTNLVVTLLATNGVTAPSGPKTNGVVVAGGASVTNQFTFTASGSCGGNITAGFHLQDGANDLGLASLSLKLGAPLGLVTNNFTNAAPISISDVSPALIYPSSIPVSGLAGNVSKVTVTLRGLTHTFPDDLDLLLVGPAGQKTYLMSDAGGGGDVNGITLTFDDSAASSLGNSSQLVSGTFKPTNFGGSDTFSAPAPGTPYSTNLAAFNGTDANGNWSLYIMDDGSDDIGALTNGWTLSLTTSNLVCCTGALPPSANLALSQTASPASTNVGGAVTFTLTVTNLGPNTATNVVVSNTLPAGLAYLSATPAAVGTNGNVFTFALGTLTNGAKSNIVLQAAATLSGARTNTAIVSSATTDPTNANNSASAVVTLNAFPVISALAGVTTNEDTVAGPVAFTISDAETTASALTLTASSSNTNLVTTNRIVFGGSATNRTITLSPITNQSGTATITLTVSDGLASTNTSFLFTVNAVNDAPLLSSISNRTMVETTTLTFTNFASDMEAPPQLLTFALGNGAPTNATLNPSNGVFSWTPTEAQGPGTTNISIIVTDNGSPSLSATQAFTITVLETNSAPTLATNADQTIYEGQILTVTNLATDTDLPTNTLTFTLASGAPTNAALNPTNGVFTWTPIEAQGPSSNLITVIVTDDGTPSLNATQSFSVFVLETNSAPALNPNADQIIFEHQTLTVTNAASDLDLPTNAFTFSLGTNAPAGATINPTNGVFSWTPAEAQGPGTNPIVVIVTDDGTPGLSATQSFSVIILETNAAPALAAIADRTIHAGSTLAIQAAATDPDLPTNTLTFTLDAGHPATASIGATNGLLTWATTSADLHTTNTFIVRVTDDGGPPLSDTQTFTVTVAAPLALTTLARSNDVITATWHSIAGATYRLQSKATLDATDWTDATNSVTATGPTTTQTVPVNAEQYFYRITLIP